MSGAAAPDQRQCFYLISELQMAKMGRFKGAIRCLSEMAQDQYSAETGEVMLSRDSLAQLLFLLEASVEDVIDPVSHRSIWLTPDGKVAVPVAQRAKQ